jgi:hypothetical protein
MNRWIHISTVQQVSWYHYDREMEGISRLR